jgi:hypothetical protein
MNVNDNPNVAVLNVAQLVMKIWRAREIKIVVLVNDIIVMCQNNFEGQIEKSLKALL